MSLDKILKFKEPVILPLEDGVTWNKKTNSPRHLHPKHGAKPIGIFHSLKENELSLIHI